MTTDTDTTFVDRGSDLKAIEKEVKNKFKWSWLDERDSNGDLLLDYFRKVPEPGVGMCVFCNVRLLYGGRGKSFITRHAKSSHHLYRRNHCLPASFQTVGFERGLSSSTSRKRKGSLNGKPEGDGSEDYDSEAGCLVDVSSIDRTSSNSALKRETETEGYGSESGALVGNSDNENERSANAGQCHNDCRMDLLVEEHGSEDGGEKGKDQNSLEGEWDEGSASFMDNPEFIQKCKESSSFEDPDGNDYFFRSCSRRMSNLPLPAQSLLRLQITQLFFNAENPDIADVEITTFPQARIINGVSTSRHHV